MANTINISVKSNARDWVKYLNRVPTETQLIIDENIPNVRSRTKRKVKSYLTNGSGVNEGIYKKSFVINNYAESKWHVGFQVFAKKPHYRLTHLLEYGHRKKVFRWGVGKQTKWGNVGMVFIQGQTKSIPHIQPSQEYAEEAVIKLYDKAIKKSLERIKK